MYIIHRNPPGQHVEEGGGRDEGGRLQAEQAVTSLHCMLILA